MKNGPGRESGRCVELGFSEGNCSTQTQLSGEADDVWRGAIVLDFLKSAAL